MFSFSFSKLGHCFEMLGISIAYLRHSEILQRSNAGFLAELGFPLGITLRLDLTSSDISLVI